MSAINISKICCIGAGYVGGPTMAVIADNCPDLRIDIVDVNEERINDWNCVDFENLPVYEPGLKDILKRTRGKNLFFSTEVKKYIREADLIFLCVNTPTKHRGIGAGKASDLRWIEICAREISKYAQGETIVVEKSTVPVKTAEILKNILYSSKSSKTFSVLSNPEFLAEGSAIKDLQNPSRVLIGGEDEKSMEALSSIYSKWVEQEKILRTNLWSSELSKLSANAFLAQRISSINSISAICEKTGADISEVSKSIGADYRIGDKFLQAGPGFGGSCFKKDLLNLVYLCEFFNLIEVSKYWESVIKLNDWQKDRISKLVVEKLFGTLNGKKITILGFAFKANTNDTRESASIDICKNLLEEGSILAIHDPKVSAKQIQDEFQNCKFQNSTSSENYTWNYFEKIDDALRDANAVIILTEWEEYKEINWEEKENLMLKPSWIFDTRLILDLKRLKNTTINYWRLGSSINNHTKKD
ncbi:nucleotide sugar dehydrogenase [uncultured Prochlorococcus sp.]|uniref:nucleotide sugar dehydrogenase n=1 Tax=uncultured Prochlorococcus sp. TaxID=159733 RepID=UPI00258E4B6B|nr:nucleotide sugar dehydrogenase [uncultured Prochlorococcus sp.]